MQIAKAKGCSRVAVTRWENNGEEPSYGTLIIIAKFPNVSVDYLIGATDDI